jgi:DNA (cytosine-5)-methyltransferase 1
MLSSSNLITVIDLYAGCGGLSLGFQNAGFNLLAAYDNWDAAINVYKENFAGHKIIKLDLSSKDIDFSQFKKHNADMIIGGPPCQDFSHAGKRNEDLGRGNLTVTFAEIVTTVKPKWFVMENVDRTVKSNKYKLSYEMFEKAGYGLTEKILTASLCGVPQLRKRLFLIGELHSNDNFLIHHLESNLSKKHLTVREYLGNNLGLDHYYRHPRNYSRRAIFSIDEPSPTVRGVNRPVAKGYPGHPGDSISVSTSVRPLTTIERSYIQTFPENFIFKGSKTELEQMIGNAVPVKLAQYVGERLMEYIRKVPINTKGYCYMDSFFMAK